MKITYEELNSIYQVRSLLENLGLLKIKEREKFFLFSSPFRKDRNPSMALYKSNLFVIDFSSGYRNSLSKFMKELVGKDLQEYLGIDKKEFDAMVFKNSLRKPMTEEVFFRKERPEIQVAGKLHPVTRNPIAADWCDNRFLSKDIIKAWDISYAEFIKMNGMSIRQRVIIPIIENGKMLSAEARAITEKQKPKTLYPRGGTVSTLFRLDNLDKKKTLIVVEGIMDIPKIWRFVTHNVTTTFGVMITGRQKELLSDFDDIILFPDGDEAGEEMIKTFDDFYDREFRIAFIPEKDPGDSTVKEIDRAITNSVTSARWFLDKSGLFTKEK